MGNPRKRRENAHPIHSDLTDVELATFCCGYLTAEHMLDRARLSSGERILVTGASGGVGSAIIQLARLREAEPVALIGPGKDQAVGAQHELLKLCGKAFCCKSHNISFNDDRQRWAEYYRPLTNPRAGLGQCQAG